MNVVEFISISGILFAISSLFQLFSYIRGQQSNHLSEPVQVQKIKAAQQKSLVNIGSKGDFKVFLVIIIKLFIDNNGPNNNFRIKINSTQKPSRNHLENQIFKHNSSGIPFAPSFKHN